MWAPPDVWELNKGCVARGLPLETSKELLKWLVVRKAAGAKGLEMSPSHTIDKLLHWVLLNSHVRKQLEQSIGEIHHSTATAKLPEEEKAKRRLMSMEALAAFDWSPTLDLWQEPGTLFINVREIRLKEKAAKGTESPDTEVVKYCLNTVGWREVYDLVLSKKFTCSPEDRAYLDSCRESLAKKARDEGVKYYARLAKQSLKRPRDDGRCPVNVIDCKGRRILFSMCKQRGTLRQIQEGVKVQWGIDPEHVRWLERQSLQRLIPESFREFLLKLPSNETLYILLVEPQVGC